MNIDQIDNVRSNRYWIACLIWVEILILSVFRTNYNSAILPFLLLVVGLLVCLIRPNQNSTKRASIPFVTVFAILGGLIAYILYRAPLIFDLIPIDYKTADMLPVMDVMSSRWIDGNEIYTLIPEIWGGMDPIYLPAMWLPIVVAKLAVVDIRWIGTAGMIAVLLLSVLFGRYRMSMSSFWILIGPIAFFLIWHYRYYLNIPTMTNEGIVFFYYLLLCWSIARDYPILIGLSMTLCLLSRYMIAPWIVMIFFAYCVHESRTFSLKMFLSIIISMVVLLTVGNAWGNLTRFLSLSGHYLEELMMNQWKYESLIAKGLSLVRYVDYENIPNVHNGMSLLSILVPAACFIYFFKHQKTIDFKLFALSSMKLSLVVFFAFLTMPYHYLYYSSFVVTIGLIAYVLSREVKLKEALTV